MMRWRSGQVPDTIARLINGGNRNMKETYEELDMEIIVFEGDDVIVMSPDPLDPTGPDDVPIA